MMIADESVPSFLENNVLTGSSISSSESITSSTDEEQTTNLERKTSISLYNVNVSSTPHAFKPLKKCKFRLGSHYDIVSDYEYKPKRKKYDHIESKVKQYRNEIRKQSEYRRALRQQEESQLKEELENKFRFQNNLSNFSPIVKSNDENDAVFIDSIEFTEKHNRTLSEIENSQLELTKIKAATITPRLNRKKNLHQSSMIKTCLFKNSSSANRRTLQVNNNTTRSTLFEGDSTCRTFDIEDLISPEFNLKDNSSFGNNNPFIVKSPCPVSPDANSIANSSASLLIDHQTKASSRRRNIVYKFFNNFIKCPTTGFIQKLKYEKKNKIYPIVPSVLISSPINKEKSFSESFEFIENTYYSNNNENLLDSTKQELLLKEMTDCYQELTEKNERFKKLFADYLSARNNK